ncbi:MAG TPA: hypothetical protein VJ508_18955, partial [Saprospiraceae bacterium]|nr:hypothetical protein [Saprospiraceae bacterium]
MTGRFPPVSEYFLLGKALKAHATAGKLRLQIEDRFKPYINAGSFLFFDFNGSKVPFQVADVEDDVHFVVTFQDMNSKDQADMLSGKECWIPIGEVKSRHLNSPRQMTDTWSDYYLFDRSTLKAYEILRTEEFPQQLMAVI